MLSAFEREGQGENEKESEDAVSCFTSDERFLAS
jgi:hypothetical protein